MFTMGAAFGAVVMYVYTYALQKHDAIKKKRAECPHRNMKLIKWMDYKTWHCPDCGHQEAFKDKDKDA